MKVVHCTQGSEEWHLARAGVITASKFKTARERLKSGPRKGEFSTDALNYAFRLAVEQVSGTPLDEGFETWQMRRGHELEPEARAEHEIQAGVIVQQAGFVLSDDGAFGASADGLIGIDGGSEYKCLVSPEGMRKVLVDGDISEFIDQVQGCMWITGRQWWHFALYCPALASVGKALWWVEVPRDEDYIRNLAEDLMTFRGLVDANVEALQRPADTEAEAARATAAAQAAAKNTQAQPPQQVLKAEAATPDATDRGPAVTTTLRGGAMGAGQAAAAAPKADEPATLNLGAICARLGFTVSAAFLAEQLQIQPARSDKAARYYTEGQFRSICRGVAQHVLALAEQATEVV